MLIVCPSCRHAIRVVDLRPGRFTPRCPRCEGTFQITVPEEKGRSPVVEPLEASVFAEPVANGGGGVDQPALDVPELEWPERDRPAAPTSGWPQALPRGVPRVLGGHFLTRLLGHGPRGQAFLSRPVGLGEPEVIKLVDPARRADRVFRAHHAREAFASSLLHHPNLAAVLEVGSDRGCDFAVVERVTGRSVAELLAERSRIEPYLAAVLVLQAARGLRAAHAQGLWHRDVKPENLRLGPDGLLKVDDLGLEMTPSLAAAIEARRQGTGPEAKGRVRPDSAGSAAELPVTAAVGSPAYMAPEQAADPITSDGRADIYALGGTFYTMITSRPPFLGENAVELIRKHREEPVVPAREFVPTLARPIQDVIQTMMGKRLDERYPSMGVVVEVLEGLLGVRGERAQADLAADGGAIRQAAAAFEVTPAAQIRFRAGALAVVIWLGFTLLLLSLGLWSTAAGIFEFGLTVATAVAVSSAVTHRSPWLELGFDLLLGGGVRSWRIAFFVLLTVGAVWFLGGFGAWLSLIIAGGLAWAFHIFLDRPVADERKQALDQVWPTLRRLRTRGHDEEVLLALVVREAGKAWKPLYAGLFGSLRAGAGNGLAAGVDASRQQSLLGTLARRLEARRDRGRLAMLEQCEEGRLEASGLNLLTARRKARRTAKAMVVTAAQWRDEQRLLGTPAPARVPTPGASPLLERIHRAAEQPEPVLEPMEPARGAMARRTAATVSFLLGRKLRFVIAAALAAILAIWLDEKGIITAGQVRDQAAEVYQVVHRAMATANPGLLRSLSWSIHPEWTRFQQAIDWPWLPESVRGKVAAANLAAAVGLLLVSLVSGRWLSGLMAIVASAAAIFDPGWGLFLPSLAARADGPAQARYLAAVILLLGLFWPRRRGREPG